MNRLIFSITFLFGSVLAGAASADVLYDNFGPGDSYVTGSGATLGTGDNFDQGFGFLIGGGDFFLDSVDAAIGFLEGVNQVTLNLYDSVAGEPGSILDSATVVGLPSFGGGDPPSTFTFSGTTVLEDGVSYFLIGSTINDGNAWSAWNFNDTGAIGDRVIRTNLGPWTVTPNSTDYGAMRINGTSVPEPGSLSLLAFAAIGLFMSKRRRR